MKDHQDVYGFFSGESYKFYVFVGLGDVRIKTSSICFIGLLGNLRALKILMTIGQ